MMIEAIATIGWVALSAFVIRHFVAVVYYWMHER